MSENEADAMDELTGSLLVAHPVMKDPNFRRTVLYMVAHDQVEGAFGVVINRRIERTLDELLPGKEVEHMEQIPVYWGGPVATGRLSLVRLNWHPEIEMVEFQHNLTVEEAGDMVGRGVQGVRAIVGYSGWTAGQLESELQHHAWVVRSPRSEYLGRDEEIWNRIMRELGPWYLLQANEPDNPSLN